ncbi:hypothetical protein H1R20_g13642, partial [Candolleomyces eurysporus]
MLARISTIVALTSSLFLLAAATPGGHGNGGHGGNNQVSQCNDGSVMCCNQVQDAKALDKNFENLIQGIGGNASNLQGLVGANCSPVNVMAGGTGGSCSGQQLCCQNNHNNGLVATGCNPVSIAA